METPSTHGGRTNGCCVVLMMKSAARSKRRLADEIGAQRATQAAQRLLGCASEDLTAWPGMKCVAPSDADERSEAPTADVLVVQRGGNLGERIAHVNEELVRQGIERQLFIGSDCPSLDVAYLERAAVALSRHDAVLGPAADGGVVLMGVRGRWPPLAALPWSTGTLCAALRTACARAGTSAATLPTLRDIDTLDDLVALHAELAGDPRPARRALVDWLATQQDLGA
jgi:rSAM/selenodomain-associated transferase 1